MLYFSYLGFIFQTAGSILLVFGYLPQIVKLIKTKIPNGISLLFWTMIATGCTAILINMIIQGTSLYIEITQAINATLAWTTLILVIYYRKLNDMTIKVSINVIFVSMIIAIYLIYILMMSDIKTFGNALQLFGTACLLTAYLPQILHLYKVKDATGISRWLFITIGTGLLLITFNMFMTGTSIWIILTEYVNIALISTQFLMTVYYQRKNKKQA